MISALTADRFSVPKAETLVEKVAEIDLDMDFVDGEEKQSLEEVKAGKIWRALRITSKTRLNQFEKLEDSGNLKALLEEQNGDVQESKQEELHEAEGLGDAPIASNTPENTEMTASPDPNPHGSVGV
jgi:THO complex subunit 1